MSSARHESPCRASLVSKSDYAPLATLMDERVRYGRRYVA
jgi:hypothetical protein